MTGDNDGAPWANVLWFHSDGSSEVTHDDLQAMCTFVGNAWASNIVTHTHILNRMTGCHTSFYSADLDLLEADATFSIAGTIAGDAVPAQVCVGISWQVTAGYKGGHPRQYVAGFPQTKMLGVREITGDYASTLAAGANTFLTSVNAFSSGGISELHLVCMSFVRNKLWRTPPVPITIHSAHVDPRVDTQRRRLGPDLT